MSLELQWFIYLIIEAQLMTNEECKIVIDMYTANNENDKDLKLLDVDTFAQEAFDLKTEFSDELHAEKLLIKYDKIISEAAANAKTGKIPPEHTNNIEEFDADFSNVSKLNNAELSLFLQTLLLACRNYNASNLHISAGSFPFIRHNLNIIPLSEHCLTDDEARKLNTLLLSKEQAEEFKSEKELCYSLSFAKEELYRVNLIEHNKGTSGIYHLLLPNIIELSNLGLTKENITTILEFLDNQSGLILVTGSIGSGKTTTLASLVETMNLKRFDHIIMIEDPIEIIQQSANCNITQREIKTHTKSYYSAIKSALRQDPDVIIIGELNNPEIIELALSASEAGHLVIGMLSTANCVNAINRIINSFPILKQSQIRSIVAKNLRGIICQKLIPTYENRPTAAFEILVNTPAVKHTIIEGKYYLLDQILQNTNKFGMCSMDNSIYQLYQDNIIPIDTAISHVTNKSKYEPLINSLCDSL